MRSVLRAALWLFIGITAAALADQPAVDSPLPQLDAPQAPAPAVDLAPVIVKGSRLRQESLAEQVRKAMQARPQAQASTDLNKASTSMKNMAGWMSDPDAYRHSPGDHRYDSLPPPGDETNGCGADLTLGCEKAR